MVGRECSPVAGKGGENPPITWVQLKGTKIADIEIPPDFKTDGRAAFLKTVWYRHKDTHVDTEINGTG